MFVLVYVQGSVFCECFVYIKLSVFSECVWCMFRVVCV